MQSNTTVDRKPLLLKYSGVYTKTLPLSGERHDSDELGRERRLRVDGGLGRARAALEDRRGPADGGRGAQRGRLRQRAGGDGPRRSVRGHDGRENSTGQSRLRVCLFMFKFLCLYLRVT